MKLYTAIKEYGTDFGIRCVYRNYKAKDSTRFIHGHSLGFRIFLGGEDKHELMSFVENSSAWMFEYIEEAFNYATIISTHDPFANVIIIMETEGLADIRLMEDVGVQHFASMIMKDFNEVLESQTGGKIVVECVEVVEHQSGQKGLA